MCICYTSIHLTTLLPLLIMNIMLCMAACNNAEYEINGECCPMCDPGKRVKNHCDENTSTTCTSCPAMTYTSSPNGLTECLPCFVCDSSNGLRVKQACTLISNTVCEPLPGYYCIDLFCLKAMKHSTCSPGQYINQTGTEFSDTVCDDCPVGSYSDGTFCKLYTNCESLGKITVKEGTDTTDAQCSNGAPHLLPLILSMCGVLVLFIIVIIVKKKNFNWKYSGVNQVTNQVAGDEATTGGWMISIENHVICECVRQSFITGLAAVFNTYYIFNLQYSEEASRTLEFVQRRFIGLLPERGTKASQVKVISKKTGKLVHKKASTVKPHVAILIKNFWTLSGALFSNAKSEHCVLQL